MNKTDLQKINEAILISSRDSIKKNIGQACAILGVDTRTAEVNGALSLSKIHAIAKELKVLIQPATITLETWLKLAQTPDEHLNIVKTLSDD